MERQRQWFCNVATQFHAVTMCLKGEDNVYKVKHDVYEMLQQYVTVE